MLSRRPIVALAVSASAFLLAAPAAARGATFHCDPAKGDPGGDGSAERPWRTIEEAIAAGKIRCVGKDGKASNPEAPVQPGDTVLLRSGWHGSIRVEDCWVYSTLDPSSWTAKDWVERPRSGVWLGRHGRRHAARNNYVLNVRFGIELCAPECLCEGNVVANFSADGIRVTRDGQIVRRNVIRNNLVSDRDGDPNHDDGIQAFLFNVGTGTLRDVTIRENIIIARDAEAPPFPNPLQGIGCFDGPLVRFAVEGNVVCVDHWHGVSLADAQGCSIRDNACFSPWGGEARPWVMLGQKKGEARGNVVRGNWAHSFHFQVDPDVKEEGNRPVTEEAFERRRAELSALIDGEFGAVHPVAGRPRLAGKATPGSSRP